MLYHVNLSTPQKVTLEKSVKQFSLRLIKICETYHNLINVKIQMIL